MRQITVSEEDLIAILYAASQQSCCFDKDSVSEQLWHLHCCDYNEPIYKMAQVMNGAGVRDEESKEWLEEVLTKGKEHYEENTE